MQSDFRQIIATCVPSCAKAFSVLQSQGLVVKLTYVLLLLQRVATQVAAVPLPSNLHTAPATADGAGWTGRMTNIGRGRHRSAKVNTGCCG